MASLYIDGSYALEGEVKPSGSKDASILLIIAALFSNQDVIIDNVPRNDSLILLVNIIENIGAKISWIGDNKLVVNGSSISTHIIPGDLATQLRFSLLLVGPLLYRFGQAEIPKLYSSETKLGPINRWVETWDELGISMETDEKSILLNSHDIHPANINFKISTLSGTSNAILSSVAVSGETIITNAAEEVEIDDLINFLNLMGANIERPEPRKIKIIGVNQFNSASYIVQPDKVEAISYAAAAIATKGNITIKGIKGLYLTSFVNFLNKVNIRFEFENDQLKVWHAGEDLLPVNVESAPAPGFLADWLCYAVLILNQAQGVSLVHDTIYTDRFGYIQDLNRMGGDIMLKRCSEVGLMCVISDESYDYNNLGEPLTVAQIKGPQKLKGARLNMNDPRHDSFLAIAALSAEGKSELIGIEGMKVRYEKFFDKLSNLGARISD